ncbi:MAG TPA: hypothetical protein ENJ08_03190 [Gammaproteobacteria bacterium]|nr:hypothetical protein [Gammaproteobacteria bacterium]
MRLRIFNNLAKVALIALLSSSCIIYTTANAAFVYNFDATGTIDTSGGLDGLGLGTLFVGGAFTATFDTTTIQFSNINITTNPSSSFVFPDYSGTFDSLSFSGSQPVSILGLYNTYSGTFDGTNLNIAGVFYDPYYDGYTYNYNISASVSSVPVPAAVWLFGSGLLGLLGIAKRKKPN